MTSEIASLFGPHRWRVMLSDPDVLRSELVRATADRSEHPARRATALAEAMALANAALPDGSSWKVTWDDVRELRGAAEDSPKSVALHLRSLAYRIAAILPPEG